MLNDIDREKFKINDDKTPLIVAQLLNYPWIIVYDNNYNNVAEIEFSYNCI